MAAHQRVPATRRWLVTSWTLLIVWGTVGHALGQPGPRLAPPQPAMAPVPVVAADEGYWIISARHCDRRLGASQCDRFEVSRYDAAGRGQAAALQDFYASLVPGVPVCFMMHGSFVDWETVRRDSQHTNSWLRSGAPGRPLHVVFFSWPSDDTPRIWLPIDIALLGRRAARHGFFVAEILSMVPEEHPICLIGHSHGARMVVSTLHVLGGGQVDDVVFGGGPYHRHRIRVVLAAAAFDHNWLNPGELYDRAIYRPEAILNLINRRDLALGFYPLHRPLITSAAAARSGITSGDRQEIGPLSRKIVDFDITDRLRAGHIWPHYYSDPAIARSISNYVFFSDLPQVAAVREAPEPLAIGSRVQLESHNALKWELRPTSENR